MSPHEPTDDHIVRLQTASEWIQRLNDEQDPALAEACVAWCQADPRNQAAFKQLKAMWHDFSHAQDSSPRPASSSAVIVRRNRMVAVAAGVLLLIGLAGWLAFDRPVSVAIATVVAERRHVALADGSLLDLAPDSRVTTVFTRERREVRLERGQAFFTVAHSGTRPFVVRAAGVTINGAGTAFDVRIGENSTVVTVRDGRVAVEPTANEPTSGGGATPGLLPASGGQRVTYSASARDLSVASIDPELAGAWRDGTLRFLGESLQDVVAEVNRYSPRRISIAATLQQNRFTGTLSPAHVDDWLRALEQVFAVEVVDRGDRGLHIQSRGTHDADS